MRQYGKGWWLAFVVLGALLGVFVATTGSRADLVNVPVKPVEVDPATLKHCCGAPLDMELLRGELAAFSGDGFTVTSFNVVYYSEPDGVSFVEESGRPYEIVVETKEQADFVRGVLGPKSDWLVGLVVGDPDLSFPEPAPASMYDRSYEEKIEARKTLLRIIQNGEGGRVHAHVFRNRGEVQVAFDDDKYLELAYQLFGPDVTVLEEIPLQNRGGSILLPLVLTPRHGGMSGWERAGVISLGGVAGLLLAALTALAIRQVLGRHPHHSVVWGALGLGLVGTWLAAAADLLPYGYRGWGWAQTGAAVTSAVVVLAAVVELARHRFVGWRRALAVGSIPIVVVLAITHAGWRDSQPSHLTAAMISVESPVTALPRPSDKALRADLKNDAQELEASRRSPTPAWWRELEVEVVRASYPLELTVRVFGDGSKTMQSNAERLLQGYVQSRVEDPLGEPRGTATAFIASAPQPVDHRIPRVVTAYGLGAVLLVLLIPWPWWRRRTEVTGSGSSDAGHPDHVLVST
jgi:hypothetical protein